VSRRIADGKVIALIRQFFARGVLDELRDEDWPQGAPQGGVPCWLDHLLTAEGFPCIRYADDFVILCATRGEAERALDKVRQWMAEAKLTRLPTKTNPNPTPPEPKPAARDKETQGCQTPYELASLRSCRDNP
jgi:RNA-directed DNA polymerase